MPESYSSLSAQRARAPRGRRVRGGIAGAAHVVCSGGVLLASFSLPALQPMALAQGAAAAAATKTFDVPAGPLAQAIGQFAQQAGVFVSGASDLAQGQSSPGVKGAHSVPAGFAALLAGTGLEAAPQANGGYALRRAVAQAAPVNPVTAPRPTATPAAGGETLQEVKVTDQALHDGLTEGTGSYTTDSSSAATGMNLSLRETPQSVTVITRERMDDVGINSLGDAAAQAPGILYQQGGSSVGGYASLYSRGYSVSSLVVDGVPVPSSAVAGYGAIQGLGTLNTDVYDSVTVVRGATGLMTGAGDPSAALVVTRKRPTPEFQASVSQSLGSWSQRRTVGDVGGPLNQAGTLRGRVVGAYEEGRSWQQGYKFDKYVGYGVLEADLSPRTLVTVALEFSGDNARGAGPYTGYSVSDVEGNPTPFGRHDNAQAEWSGFKDRRVGVSAALEHRFNDDWKAKLTYSRNQVKTKQRFGLAASSPEVDGTVDLHERSYFMKNSADSIGFKLEGQYELLGRKHDLVAGFNGAWSNEKNPDWYLNWGGRQVNVFTWSRRSPEPDWASLYGFGSHDKEDQQGAYVATRLRATEQLSVLGGMRWSNWRRRGFDEVGSVSETRSERGVFTPYLGLVYNVTPNISAYASYTTIFNPQYNRDLNGSLLDPETGTNIEAGLKGEWFGGRLNAGVAVFQVKKDNLAVRDGDNVTPLGDDAYRAEDNTKGRGWELEVAGEPLPGWRIQGGYTRMLTKDSSGGRLNADQPKHLFKLFTTWTPARLSQLTVGGGVTWQSSTYADWVDASWRGLYTQKSYAVVNLMARYAFSKQVALTVNLNNVFDKVYRTDMSGHNYGAPRNIYATLKYQF